MLDPESKAGLQVSQLLKTGSIFWGFGVTSRGIRLKLHSLLKVYENLVLQYERANLGVSNFGDLGGRPAARAKFRLLYTNFHVYGK